MKLLDSINEKDWLSIKNIGISIRLKKSELFLEKATDIVPILLQKQDKETTTAVELGYT